MNSLDEKQKEILNALDISLDDFTQEQLRKFERCVKNIPDPRNMTAEQAINLVNNLGLDIKKLQKKARRLRHEQKQQEKTQKIGRNEPCPCNSGKKYKKCCLK